MTAKILTILLSMIMVSCKSADDTSIGTPNNTSSPQSQSSIMDTTMVNDKTLQKSFTRSTKISDVISDESFGDFGRLIFPVNSNYYSGSTLDYEGLLHGFGLGTGTVAEGWIDDAVKFWERQM